jgi:hypothetical protein
MAHKNCQLRAHPLLSHSTISAWPPIWVSLDGEKIARLTGEVGILREVRMDKFNQDKCFLVIEHNGLKFTGCLMFNDRSFCLQMYRLLVDHCDEAIRDIAELDLVQVDRYSSPRAHLDTGAD